MSFFCVCENFKQQKCQYNILQYNISGVWAGVRDPTGPLTFAVCMVTAGRDGNAQIPRLWARCYFIRWCLKFQILSYVHL